MPLVPRHVGKTAVPRAQWIRTSRRHLSGHFHQAPPQMPCRHRHQPVPSPIPTSLTHLPSGTAWDGCRRRQGLLPVGPCSPGRGDHDPSCLLRIHRRLPNQHRLESSLKHVARPSMRSFEPNGIAGLQRPSCLAGVRLPASQQQKVVILHPHNPCTSAPNRSGNPDTQPGSARRSSSRQNGVSSPLPGLATGYQPSTTWMRSRRAIGQR